MLKQYGDAKELV